MGLESGKLRILSITTISCREKKNWGHLGVNTNHPKSQGTKERPPYKVPTRMARGHILRDSPHQPPYLHKRWMVRPILQQPNDRLWETLKHRLTKPCFWDVGVLVEVIGSIWLHYQVWGCLLKESVMGEAAGQKLAAQELVIQFNTCEVNVTVVSGLSNLVS